MKAITNCILVVMLMASLSIMSQTESSHNQSQASSVLLNEDLTRFDFFYAGEAKKLSMYIIRNGVIDWSYTYPADRGEISDAVMLSNGNVLFAHQYGIAEVTPNKKIIWSYDTPEGTEIHTAQPIGRKYVIFVQNGDPAKIVVINKNNGEITKELTIPVGNPKNIHGHFRNARLTKSGTILVAHMDMGKVCEYNADGKELFSIQAPGVWSVEPLENGNILVTCRKVVREINRNLETVWELSLADIADYTITSPQKSIRLSNGNTLISNWFNEWNSEVDMDNQPVQAIEVTSDKKIVWVLRSWQNPINLGPSTTIIPLNEPRTNEQVFFGNIR